MKNTFKKLSAVVLMAGVLCIGSVSVFGQERATEPKAAEAGHSEANHEEKPGMELWKWANFAILAGILGYLVAKNMGPMLTQRSRQIHEGLAAGERAKADAEARSAAVKEKLSGLGQTIATMRAEAHAERERECDRIRRETAAELARIGQNAAFEVESASKLARLSVQRTAAKLAIDLAEKKVRDRMSPETQAALLQNFLGEISSSTSTGKLS